jgi:two-component system response regulator AtoC
MTPERPRSVDTAGAQIGWQANSAPQPRILVVDDDKNLLRLLRTILRTGGFEVEAFEDVYLALDSAQQNHFDLVILDLRMPQMDGRSFFRELRLRSVSVPVLIASAYGARSAQLELGAEGSIEKPFDPDLLIEAVWHLVRTSPHPYL